MRALLPSLAVVTGLCCAQTLGDALAAPGGAISRPGFAVLPVRTAAKPAAAKAPPLPAPAKAFYANIPEAERNTIESDLIWTGDYNGVIGGEFGDRAIAAVKDYQKRNGGKDTGILNPEERARLGQAARARQDQAGWHMVEDPATGVRLGVPGKIAPQMAAAKAGTRWQSAHGEVQIETFRIAAPGTTLAAVFEQQRREPPERKVEYNVLRPDFFVVSGLQGLKKFYVRAQAMDGDVRGIAILYDQAMEGTMDRIAVAMSSAFAAFPARLAGAPAPRRKVEYGTGLVVSAAGDILTDSALLADCDIIVVPGLGPAERVAEDKALALLRVNGAARLVAAPLSDGEADGGEVTLVGVADPQTQNGGAAVSTARGRIAATGGVAAIEPAPGAGFAGASALDHDGKVTGIVALQVAPGGAAMAAMVPAEAAARFLGAQNVAVAAGRAGLDTVKAATVRVICVRK